MKKHLMHAKMYISNDKAITGSANLTVSALRHNIEHIEVLTILEG